MGTHLRHYLAAAKLCLNGINSTIASASPRGRTSAGVKRVFFPSSMANFDHTSGYSAIHHCTCTRVSLDPRGLHLHEAASHLIVECGEQIPNPLLCFRGIIGIRLAGLDCNFWSRLDWTKKFRSSLRFLGLDCKTVPII